MEPERDYIKINKKSWDSQVAVHLHSDFYAQPEFLAGKSTLNDIDLEVLGDVAGKKILHLQCHFGQDSISLARLGARVTGIDFSGTAIDTARQLANDLSADANFICCDVYSLPDHLDERFDIVFTSYGTIGWLPDLQKWAALIYRFLKPGGHFAFAEFHPVVWMFDNKFSKVEYRYFKTDAIVEVVKGSYADRYADIEIQHISWNHGLAEVITSLIDSGLVLESLSEFDYSPYACFDGTVEFEPGKFKIEHLDNKIPMVYTLSARRP